MRPYIIFFLFVFLLAVAACQVETPHLPSWDVTLNVPLLNEKYLLSDLVDNENIFIGDDNVLYIKNSGDLSTPSFGEVVFDTNVDLGPLPIPSGVALQGSFSPDDQTQGYQISYGEIASGSIRTRITNGQDLTALSITFDGLYTAAGAPFVINWNHNSGWQNTSLVGAKMGVETSNVLLDEISFSALGTSSQPNGTVVGNIEVQIDSHISFNKFKGILENYILPSNESAQNIDIDYPYDIEQAIELQQADLAIDLSNHIGFNCVFSGDLFARNNITGDSISIPIVDDNGNNLLVTAGSTAVPSQQQFIISNGITDLLQIMPHHIEVRNSSFRITGGTVGNIGMVTSSDNISGTYNVTAPFEFELHPHTFLLNDPIELEISQENRDRITQYGVDASLALQVLNMLPIGANATVYVGSSPDIAPADTTSYVIKREYHILPIGQAPGFQNVSLSLNEEELQVFSSPMVYVQMEFSFDSGGAPVTITASLSDYVQIRGMLSAKVHIEEGN
ncbi:MAG TPA: hypothetical protein PKI15_06620 [Candidatus Cloacimonadota bacterium]|nr:hypothetical protein [Candidatus Cloacimonadota bacterium]